MEASNGRGMQDRSGKVGTKHGERQSKQFPGLLVPIRIGKRIVEYKDVSKVLGVYIHNRLDWNSYTDKVYKKHRQAATPPPATLPCDYCPRLFRHRLGLLSHVRAHKRHQKDSWRKNGNQTRTTSGIRRRRR